MTAFVISTFYGLVVSLGQNDRKIDFVIVYIYFAWSPLRIFNSMLYADRGIAETVTDPAMRLFQNLALDKASAPAPSL